MRVPLTGSWTETRVEACVGDEAKGAHEAFDAQDAQLPPWLLALQGLARWPHNSQASPREPEINRKQLKA
eukprot:3717213-Alexandrium_andersonii.AAC.1